MTLLGYKLVCFSKDFDENKFSDCFPEISFIAQSVGARGLRQMTFSPIFDCTFPVIEIDFSGEFLINSIEQIYASESTIDCIPHEYLAREKRMVAYLDRLKHVIDSLGDFCKTKITRSFVVYQDAEGGRSDFGFECTSQLTSKLNDLDCGFDLRFIAIEAYFRKMASGDLWRL